jgi:RNA polymerase sigma factor (sigma-70 family)
LVRYLAKCFSLSGDDARDVVQQAYLICLQLPDAATVRNPGGYLFKIAVRVAGERRRREGRAAVTFDSALVEEHSKAFIDPAAALVEDLAARDHLEQILAEIPVIYRRVLVMNKRDGLKCHEIAEKLGVSVESALTYLGRALTYARNARSKLDKS